MSSAYTEKHIEEYQKRIEVMQAYVKGETIEARNASGIWVEAKVPSWLWELGEYQVKPKVPDSIDWSHVNSKYKFMARDENGNVLLYTEKPIVTSTGWRYSGAGVITYANVFSSFVEGNIDWEKSLVARPEPNAQPECLLVIL